MIGALALEIVSYVILAFSFEFYDKKPTAALTSNTDGETSALITPGTVN